MSRDSESNVPQRPAEPEVDVVRRRIEPIESGIEPAGTGIEATARHIEPVGPESEAVERPIDSVEPGLEAVERSIEEARCLPAEAYTNERFLDLERRTLFSNRWICIGLVDDVPEPGDATPLEVAGTSVILTRDAAGAVHVFHNYCRHRGLKILTEAVRGRSRFTCPYHAWTYALDGRLLRAPHFDGPGRHRTDPVDGLSRVRCAVWHRLVFVNLSGDAPEFADHIAPLERRWASYDLSILRHAESRSCDIAANWKLAVENFVDYYHLPTVHKGLNSYSAMEDHYPIREGDLFFGQGNASYAPSDEATGALPVFPDLDAAERSVTEAICLFPNLLVTLFHDNLRIILVEPDGAGRCRERIEVFVVGDEAMAPELAPMRHALVERFQSFNIEDVAIVEGLQDAFATTAFDGGRLSPAFDANLHHFQRLIAQWTRA
ncbi:MAG: aromatic ring-hydroxylating dioxygenase subunit alpha [Gammaproteobacteria bacterium]|nr:aromatic ring-hydroxylating dioxygenase subunit alpha [Gammaproteobacteria bacterium]